MINTLYQEKNGVYQKKKAEITVVAFVENKGSKKIANLTLNLSDYFKQEALNQIFPLENCQDKKAEIVLSVRGQAFGRAETGENFSESSGGMKFSMGTEDDFQGNLFSEQDLKGFDVEQSPKVSQNYRFSMSRPGMMTITDSAPNKPMKIYEAMDTQHQKLEEENPASKLSELKASSELLEKENIRLKLERDEVKANLSVLIEKTKLERENYFEYMKKLDCESEMLKKRNKDISEKVVRRDEKIASLKKVNQSLLEDLNELERNLDEKESENVEASKAASKLGLCERELAKTVKKFERMKGLKEGLEVNNNKLQVTVSYLKEETERLRKELSDLKDVSCFKDWDDPGNNRKNPPDFKDHFEELKILRSEKEENLVKISELMSQVQILRNELTVAREKHSKQVSGLEKNNKELAEEILEIKRKVGMRMKSKEDYEKQSSLEKYDYDSKFSKMTQIQNELISKTENLEKTIKEYEILISRKDSESSKDKELFKKLIEKYQSKKKIIQNNRESIKSKEKTVEDLLSTKNRLEQEISSLKSHLKTATTTEFSDPANIVLQEQVQYLESKLRTAENDLSANRNSLSEKIKILESQVAILEKKKKETDKNFEGQTIKLLTENRILQEQVNKLKVVKPNTTEEIISDMEKQSNDQVIQLLKIEIEELKNKNQELVSSCRGLEKRCAEFKMSFANSEVEKENIRQKYKDAQEKLREFSERYTAMEVEFYKVSERFGSSVNANNELENEVNLLRKQLEGVKEKGLIRK